MSRRKSVCHDRNNKRRGSCRRGSGIAGGCPYRRDTAPSEALRGVSHIIRTSRRKSVCHDRNNKRRGLCRQHPGDCRRMPISLRYSPLRGVAGAFPISSRDEPAEVGLPCPQDRSRGSCRRHPGDCRRMPLSLPYSPLRCFARAFPIDCALAGHRPPVGSGRCLLRLNSTAGIPPNRRTPGLRPSKEGAETGMGFLSPYQPVRSPVSERQRTHSAPQRPPQGILRAVRPTPGANPLPGTAGYIPGNPALREHPAGSGSSSQARPRTPCIPYGLCQPMPLRRTGSAAE